VHIDIYRIPGLDRMHLPNMLYITSWFILQKVHVCLKIIILVFLCGILIELFGGRIHASCS
jgi:hypothetical protein